MLANDQLYERRVKALERLVESDKNPKYDKDGVAIMLSFLRNYHKDPGFKTKSWPEPEVFMVGLRIRLSKGSEGKVGRKDIADSLKMGLRDVDRYVSELRKHRLVGSGLPYGSTEMFDCYFSSLRSTAELGRKVF